MFVPQKSAPCDLWFLLKGSLRHYFEVNSFYLVELLSRNGVVENARDEELASNEREKIESGKKVHSVLVIEVLVNHAAHCWTKSKAYAD